ncbi:MAG: DNA-binding protein [Firmicutes bacterium]|nr:DNA-binding protein [Bacillota bacterium]
MDERVALLLRFDRYAPLLTDGQREFLHLHYEEDWSLGEIATIFGLSRQAVNDRLRRAEALLQQYEERLHLCEEDALRRYCGEQLRDWAAAQPLSDSGRAVIECALQALGVERETEDGL